MIHFNCPHCQKRLKAPELASGQKVSCPRCGQDLIIPPPVHVEAVFDETGPTLPQPDPLGGMSYSENDLPPSSHTPYALIVAMALGMLSVLCLVLVVALRPNSGQRTAQRLPPPAPAAVRPLPPASGLSSSAPTSAHQSYLVNSATDEAEVGAGKIFAYGILLAIFILLYVAPSIIAFLRGHQNRAAILAMNILLGWIVLGWIMALIWALTEVSSREHRHFHYHDHT